MSALLAIDSDRQSIHMYVPRWRLTHDLEEIQQLARTSGFVDPNTLQTDRTTQRIWNWARAFSGRVETARTQALYLDIYEESIGLMQSILVDSRTGAPLDRAARYGSDGYTYGQILLAIIQLMRPPELRNRSPMNEEDPRPFSSAPHPVAQRMIQWLIQHDAFLYSPEVEEMLVNLLPREEGLTPAMRIERFIAQQEEVRRVREVVGIFQIAQFERDIRRLAGEETKALTDLERRMDQRVSPLPAVAEQIALWQQDEARAIESLSTRVENHLRAQAEPIIARADVHASRVGDALDAQSRRIAVLRGQLQQRMAGMQEELVRVEQSNATVAGGNAALAAELVQLEQQLIQVKSIIQQVRADIKNKTSNPLQHILTAAALATGCVCLTAGVQYLLPELGATIAPLPGGGVMRMMIKV